MTTTTCTDEMMETTVATQNETAVSDLTLTDVEIMRRVRNIRSSWSLSERRARREEADRRFENLIETIFAEAA